VASRARARILSHHRDEDVERRSGRCRLRAGTAGFAGLRCGPRVREEAGSALGHVKNGKGVGKEEAN
jgi:hypothetical protein